MRHQQQHQKQQQQQHVQKQKQPQIAQQQRQAPSQHHHDIKPAEESMGLNLEQYMPQAKPPPQHREVDQGLDEDAALKKLSKGQLIHHSLHNVSILYYRQQSIV